MPKYAVGVDLGGTNVRAVLVNEMGQVCSYSRELTKSQEGPDGVIAQITALVRLVIKEAGVTNSQVQGLGIGLPGVIDSNKGVAITLPNLKGWRDVPVGELLEDLLQLPVYCENDARMAAWGEKIQGAGRNYQDLVCLTLGTGVGSGIFLAGKMWRGYQGSAGEIGHLTVVRDGLLCSCGNRGCLEMYVSGGGIAHRARQAASRDSTSQIYQAVGGKIQEISAVTVYKAAQADDQTALNLIQETADYLGLALANLSNILNPELFILGGGLSNGWGELLLKPVRKVVEQRAMSLNKEVKIVQAQLGDKAGVIGAAEMALSLPDLTQNATRW
ncbi:MAG: ROK family protein [Peptococcia bacterium]